MTTGQPTPRSLPHEGSHRVPLAATRDSFDDVSPVPSPRQPVLTVRIDQMPETIEAYGQVAWNRTVEIIGKVITSVIGPRDTAALCANDRFLITLADGGNHASQSLMPRVRHAVERSVAGGEIPVPVTLTMGTTVEEVAQAAQIDSPIIRARGPALLKAPVIAPASDRPVILIVDDDTMVAQVIQASLADTHAVTLLAGRVSDALEHLQRETVDVVITDIHMPNGSGFELLDHIQRIDAGIVVIVITGIRNLDLAVKVVRSGAHDFLIKPFTPDDLRASVRNGLHKRQMILNGKAYQALLKSQVQQHARDLEETLRHLETTYRDTLKALGAALDTRDIETHAHSERVAQFALTLGRVIGMTVPELTTLERGVYLHDIGKIGIPDRVLLKDGALLDEEWEVMRRHPQLGYRLASRVQFLKDAAKIILSHHERYDGTGYPFGLKGETIPVGARVFAVVDALDAMTSDRPYRKARSIAAAREEIGRHRDSQFDPRIVDAFMSVPEPHWRDIRESVMRAVADRREPSEEELLREARTAIFGEGKA